MDGKKFKHESYGKIVVTKTSSSGTFLFGSEAKHHHFVHVEIEEAEMNRDLSHNWLFGGKRLLEFHMTESQWAHFVSSFSDGTGTPITLRYVNGKGMEPCPPPEQFRAQFASEVKERVDRAVEGLRDLSSQLRETLKPGNKPLGKKDLAEVLSTVDRAVQEVSSNLPYIFNESMDKKMTDAKIEFESIVAYRLQEMGLASLRNSLPENDSLGLSGEEKSSHNFVLADASESASGTFETVGK
jgi:hypothetical protein